jgi:CheY-like chemotaxis protein
MAERKTILIVDDEPDVRTYLAALLGDHGYETVTAADAESARQALAARRPDLVTLDINMPATSGVRLYRELRESDACRRIPVVIVTGISGDFRRFISTRRHVPPPDGYLQKPIDQKSALAEISRCLHGDAAQPRA